MNVFSLEMSVFSSFSEIFKIFEYFRTVVPYFEFRIYFRICFTKFLRVRNHCIFSSSNSNMKKKTFRLSRNWKIQKKNPFALPYYIHTKKYIFLVSLSFMHHHFIFLYITPVSRSFINKHLQSNSLSLSHTNRKNSLNIIFFVWWLLGPIHTQYFCTQYCDKKILR